MISKLLHWFNYLAMSPVDKLIAILGEDTVRIWNGVNYASEYKLFPEGKEAYSCMPQEVELIRIDIGRYYSGHGDWGGGFDYTSCAVVELTIDKFGKVRLIHRNIPIYNGKSKPRKIEMKIDKLVRKIKLNENLRTCRPRLKTWIDAIFEIDASIRYSTVYSVESILTRNWDRVSNIRKQIEFVATGGH